MSILVALALAAVSVAGEEAPPSLITIVTDDQGRWAMGAYGNEEIRTPNMDRIAAEGVLFTRAFVASPVCSPARATWLTGLYPTELGITDWISPTEASEGLGLRASTWPQVLQANGYVTGLFGKWHLGEAEECHPTRLGFDEFVGFLAGGNRPMDPTLEIDGEKRKVEGPLPDILTDHALAFVEKHRTDPFCVALHFRAPHLPYGPVPDEDAAHYVELDPTIPDFPGLDAEKVARATKAYYASISSIDRNIGRVLAKLDELDLAQNTIVLFTSDHGYNEGRHGINTKGNGHWIVGGRSGPKRPNMWDTSVAVPLAIRWPGTIPAGTRMNRLASNVDMYRTICNSLAIRVPEDAKARGMDLLWFDDDLRGDASPVVHTAKTAIRDAVYGQYDLHNNGLAYMRMLRNERWKFVKHFHANGMDELYDLLEDPGERTNILRKTRRENPALVESFERELADWMKSIGDPLLDDDY